MKKITLSMVLISLFAALNAQDKVRERDLNGEWLMVFNMDEEEWEDELENDSFFGRMIASSVSSLIVNVLEDLNIQFEFLNNKEVRMTVEIWNEKEIEYLEWYINIDGELIIGDKHDDEVWLFDHDKLVSYHKRGYEKYQERNIFLVRTH